MEVDYRTYLRHYPDRNGRFGPYGGAYLTEELVPAFEEIADAYQTICHSSSSSASCAASARNSREGPRRSITASAFQGPSATARSI